MDNSTLDASVPTTNTDLFDFDSDTFMELGNSKQLLTPPGSARSPSESTEIMVSTTFFPGAEIGGGTSDLIILPCDSVYFYVHSSTLLSKSENGFNYMLPISTKDVSDHFGQGSILAVPESSSVLNIVLHIIYGTPCAHLTPSLDTLSCAVLTLKIYGISPKEVITPFAPVYELFLSHASDQPLKLFSLASEYDIYDLASATSSHLLALSLPTLTDEAATRIGSTYLKRLFFMHLGRAEALKRLLMPPPYPHAPTLKCNHEQQMRLTRAWALAVASLAWDAGASVSTSTIESVLSPLGDHLLCGLCKNALKKRIEVLMEQWLMVKRTI